MSRTFRFIGKYFIKEIQSIFAQNEPISNRIQFRLLAAFASIGIGTHALYTYGSTTSTTIVVKDKYLFSRNGFTEFMIIDTTGKHYNVNNSFWYWKWDSIEDWCHLETNTSVNIHYYGYRIPFIGVFPNIFMSQSK